MKKNYIHLKHHVSEHEKAQKRLKKLINKHNPVKEKVLPIFLTTFVIALVSLLIFRNWSNITNIFNPNTPQQTTIETDGIKTGVLSVYKIDNLANRSHRNMLASVLTAGSLTGAEVNGIFGQGRGETASPLGEKLKNSIWLTSYLSTGQHLTKMQQKHAKALQKSILATYYLGEKTIDINSVLQTDSQILSQIKNTLSIDLFKYLDQAENRSDKLDEYLFLLNTLLKKTNQRINDLQYKIDFLTTNTKTQEVEIKTSESAFFENMKIFEGNESEKELAKFIGLQEDQVENKAKLGSYKTLQDYYKFFKPNLENLITAIKTNRSALIAGVKVTEIQNMSLPIIIRQKK